ncbi:MAG: hypothetical protein BWY23_02023 [Spirochaetes bacterium ADurb.Bin218]|nr:MAG: hypothetical protein BWY23_02023 [Spirochaetes bacterium ADurb.Bin218]
MKEIVDTVFKRILFYNQKNNTDAIPHSDLFAREISSLYGISKKELDIILNILKESHKIFIMEIAKEDPGKNLEKISGYVDADLFTIQRLREVFFDALSNEYERQYNSKKTANVIIKELIPKLMYINHTPIGKLLNKTIMLDEYQRHIENNYREFTEEWKEENYKIQLSINEKLLLNLKKNNKKPTEAEEAAQIEEEKNKRAVDSELHKKYEKSEEDYSLDKMIQIYGVDFFLRVNLRKYNFAIIEKAIDSHILHRKQDLSLLREMLKNMRFNFENDPEIANHMDELMSLDRKASRAISLAKK